MSPCDHASEVGAAADFVGSCISGPITGAVNDKTVGLLNAPTDVVTFTSTCAGLVAFTLLISFPLSEPTAIVWPGDKSVALEQT